MSKKIIAEALFIIILGVLTGIVVNVSKNSLTAIASQPGKEKTAALENEEPEEKDPALEPQYIDIKMAKALYDCMVATFVDARRADQYKEGHVLGSISLPYGAFPEQLPDFEAEYPGYGPIVTYCEGKGCELGELIAKKLIDAGYRNVFVLHPEGYSDWLDHGCPIGGTTSTD